jgi:hypothetical protein
MFRRKQPRDEAVPESVANPYAGLCRVACSDSVHRLDLPESVTPADNAPSPFVSMMANGGAWRRSQIEPVVTLSALPPDEGGIRLLRQEISGSRGFSASLVRRG